MQSKRDVLLRVLLFALLVNLAGCAKRTSDSLAQNAASPVATPTAGSSPIPKQITPAELAKLRWIEGSWRGTDIQGLPFYERYKFENDTTLLVETLEDETLSKVSDVSRFELKDGHFGYRDEESQSVATAFDDKSISFAVLGEANYFRWQRESDDSWKAVLSWTDKNGAAKERIYELERWPAKK